MEHAKLRSDSGGEPQVVRELPLGVVVWQLAAQVLLEMHDRKAKPCRLQRWKDRPEPTAMTASHKELDVAGQPPTVSNYLVNTGVTGLSKHTTPAEDPMFHCRLVSSQ